MLNQDQNSAEKDGLNSQDEHTSHSLSGRVQGNQALNVSSGINSSSYQYPEPPADPAIVSDYHGTYVPDPFRPLENATSPETLSWISEQNALTRSILDAVPGREVLVNRLDELSKADTDGVPFRHGDRFLFYRRADGANFHALYESDTPDGDSPRLLLDPDTFSSDGSISLSSISLSPDGKYLAYSLSDSGSDWRKIKIRDLKSGQDLPEELEQIKFSGINWDTTSQGFYYSRFPDPDPAKRYQDVNQNQKAYYHQIGTAQSQDPFIFEKPQCPNQGVGVSVTGDGKYLIARVSDGTRSENELYLKSGNQQFTPLFSGFDASYSFTGNDGPIFYILTDRDAPRSRLVAVDIRKPEPENWKDIIPETSRTLTSITRREDRLLAYYLSNAHSELSIFSIDGSSETRVQLPGKGSIGQVTGRSTDDEGYFSYSSFEQPSSVYKLELATGAVTLHRESKVDIDPDLFVTQQVWYQSKDGTQVPMFITHKNDLVLDGSHPALLYGYGGFNISLSSSYSAAVRLWLEMGGIYAQPSLRGGGEFGEMWHAAGMKENKQNVFDDFISAAEFLISEGYTSNNKLAIRGGSNGGLLVGACMVQRPDLFAAVLPEVGVLDMLRYHHFTIGHAWIPEYGCSNDPVDFDVLYKYSPLHNLRQGESYPATLISTSDHDDRVVPAHSYKFAAALQEAQGGPAPCLLRVENKAGHGSGAAFSKSGEAVVDRYAFLMKVLAFDTSELEDLLSH